MLGARCDTIPAGMPMVTKNTGLQIQSLTVEIEGKQVVDDFSLTIPPGECHVLMGPNGSGKSSLAYALAGHPNYSVTSGSVLLNSNDVLVLSPDQRAHLGLMLAFQYPVSVPGLSVWQFLWQAYQQRFKTDVPKSGKKIVKAIDFIKSLEKLAKKVRMPSEMLKRGLNEGFSGGEKKRLEVLQLLVLEPKFAILDETDSGLDIDAIKIIAKNIEHLTHEYGVGCLLITHYQRLLKYVVPDRIHIMSAGRIVESGDKTLAEEVEITGYTKYQK